MGIKTRIITRLPKKKVKGGALYVAVIIGIIIGVILTFFILLSEYNQRHVTIYSQSSQLYFNLKSAFEAAKSDYFTNERNNKWFKNSYNDDSVKIKKLNWGAYQVIVAETKNRHQRLSQSGMYGTYSFPDTALLVTDNSRPIGMSGKILLKANCFLPRAGIKPAYIDGQSYISSPGNSAFIKTASGSIPEINKGFIKAVAEQYSNLNVETDSLVANIPQIIQHPFSGKTLVGETGSARLSNVHLKGNIKIICRGSLVVENTCYLEDVLIICDKVKFKEGFKGNVHVIAKDSVVMEKNCEFTYPSSFVLLDQEPASGSLKCIEFNEDCRFSGAVVAANSSFHVNSPGVFVKLNAKSQVNGFIYSSGYLHVEGKINGTLIGNKLLLKTPSAVYENHMMACEIDPKKLGHIIAVPMLFSKTGKLLNCKTL